MPLTLDQLQEIQADAMADDIPIDEEKMMHWTAEEATAFFESGGTEEPAPSTVVAEPAAPVATLPTAPAATDVAEPAAPVETLPTAPAATEPVADGEQYSDAPVTKIALFLSENGFEHLFETLGTMSDADVDTMLKATKDENLAAMKERGVEKLKDRQGVAQAVLKAKRAREAAEKEVCSPALSRSLSLIAYDFAP